MEKKRKYQRKERVIITKKSKGAAIVLAVFFGLFAWLYTYKFDKSKFWVNLIITIFTGGVWGFVAWVWAIIDMSIKEKDKFDNYHKWVVK